MTVQEAQPRGLAFDFDVLLSNSTKGKFEMFDFLKEFYKEDFKVFKDY